MKSPAKKPTPKPAKKSVKPRKKPKPGSPEAVKKAFEFADKNPIEFAGR